MSTDTPAPRRTHAARYAGKHAIARTRCGLHIERSKLVPRNEATCLTCYPRTVVTQSTEIIAGPS